MSDQSFWLGSLVWARMKGYPPWPARITCPPSGTSLKPGFTYVKFFKTHNFAWIRDTLINRYNGLSGSPSKGKALTAAVKEMERCATATEKWSSETESSSESSCGEGDEEEVLTCVFCHFLFSPGDVGKSIYKEHLVEEHRIQRNRDWLLQQAPGRHGARKATEILGEAVSTSEEAALDIAWSITNEIVKEAVMEVTYRAVTDDIMDHILVNQRQQSKQEKLLCSKQATGNLLSHEIPTKVPRMQQQRAAKPSTKNESPFKKSNIIKGMMDKKYCTVKIEKVQGNGIKAWHDGNAFKCSKCDFISFSMQDVSEHNKKEHGTCRAQNRRNGVQYICHCCGKKVNIKKRAFKEHLKTHCLTMVEYNMLYGGLTKRMNKERKRKKIITVAYMEASEPLLDLKEQSISCSSSMDIIKEKVHLAGEEKRKSSFHSQVSRNEDSGELKKQEDDASQDPRKDSCTSSEELFIYLCPAANCQFAIDLQDLLRGTGDLHWEEEHGITESQIKGSWGDWSKVSINSHMELMYGEDN